MEIVIMLDLIETIHVKTKTINESEITIWKIIRRSTI